MEETKEAEAKERITYSDVHICLSCEHQTACRYAAVVESVDYVAGYSGKYCVERPTNFIGFPEAQAIAVHEEEARPDSILHGVRVCPRHSSGDPRLTHGVIE